MLTKKKCSRLFIIEQWNKKSVWITKSVYAVLKPVNTFSVPAGGLIVHIYLQRRKQRGGRIGNLIKKAFGWDLHRHLQSLPKTDGRQEVFSSRPGKKVQTEN